MGKSIAKKGTKLSEVGGVLGKIGVKLEKMAADKKDLERLRKEEKDRLASTTPQEQRRDRAEQAMSQLKPKTVINGMDMMNNPPNKTSLLDTPVKTGIQTSKLPTNQIDVSSLPKNVVNQSSLSLK